MPLEMTGTLRMGIDRLLDRIRENLFPAAGSALGVTFAFVFLRAIFTPIRIKVVTSILAPETYGAVTLLSMTAHGAALIVSMGGFEMLLQRLPSAGKEERQILFGRVLLLSSLCGMIVVGVLGVLWGRVPVFREMAGFVSPWTAGLLVLLFLHIHQRMYWFLGCRQNWLARLTQLFWSDLWFVPLLLLFPLLVLTAERVVLVWSFWLVLVCAVTWWRVPIVSSLAAVSRSPGRFSLWFVGLPLLPVILGEWIFRLSGHYVLLAHVGAVEMAFYALSLNVSLVGLIAATPLVDICIVELGHLAVGRERTREDHPTAIESRVVSHGLRHLWAVLMPAALVMIILPADIIGFLAAKSFLPAARYVPFAAVLPFLLALHLLLARLLMLFQDRRFVMFGALGSAFGAVVLCLLLVPRWGVNGALVAIMAACALVVLAFALRLKFWRWMRSGELGVKSIFLATVLLAVAIWGISMVEGGSVIRLLLAGGAAAIVILWFGLLRPSDFRVGAESQPLP